MLVAELMTADIVECSPGEPIRVVAARMNERRCGCLPVMVQDGDQKRLVGIVTDRDLACRAVAEGLDPERTEVARCMSFPVQTIAPEADLWQCAERFSTLGVRRLVVVDGGNRCRGIISRADLNRFVIDQSGSDQAQTAPRVATGPSPPGNDAVAEAGDPSVPRMHDNTELTL